MSYKKIMMLQFAIVVAIVYGGCEGKQLAKQSPKTIIDLAGYSLALDECKVQGKDAGAYSVYEACAKKADDKYGRDAGK
jgi:hypothetical protein